MSQKISIPRGTNDILPDEIFRWQNLEDKARTLMRLYGYEEIRTPIFEDTGLFKRSLGPASDVVTKQLLELKSRTEDTVPDGESYSLRPEGTAPIVRAYIEHHLDKKEGLSKLYYFGPMFRGERPQRGRLRQFHQVGVELIGLHSFQPFLDAEAMALSIRLLEGFGVEGFRLKINSLGSHEDKKNLSSILRERLKKDVRNLCPECQARFERNVFRILDCKNKECRAVVARLELGDAHLSPPSKEYFQKVRAALDLWGVAHTVSPHLVRGLDYYTHTVFEISHAGLGSQDALGAGGRYNDLVAQLGGPKDIGGMGFALGIERILLAVGGGETRDEGRVTKLDAFIVSLDKEEETKAYTAAFELLNELRRKEIAADMNHTRGSMKSQMRAADKSGARYVIIIGEDELKEDIVTLKNMASGEQRKVPQSKLAAEFNKVSSVKS